VVFRRPRGANAICCCCCATSSKVKFVLLPREMRPSVHKRRVQAIIKLLQSYHVYANCLSNKLALMFVKKIVAERFAVTRWQRKLRNPMLQYSKNQNFDSAGIRTAKFSIFQSVRLLLCGRVERILLAARCMFIENDSGSRQQLLLVVPPPPLGQISPTATFFSEKERNTNTQQAGTQSVSLEEVE
jgi:hypothetical protein